MKTLEFIDILGPECKIKIRSDDSYKTPIGGLLTILLFAVSLVVFIFLGRDLIYKEFPNVSLNKFITNETEVNLTHENLAFTIFSQKDSSSIENIERKFVFYFDVFWNYAGGYDEKKYNFLPCSNATIAKMESVIFKKEATYYCLPENTTIQITGAYLKGNFVSTRLNVDFCTKEKSGRDDCIPKNETRASMGNLQMNLILFDNYVNSLNYSEPFNGAFYTDNIITSEETFSRQIVYFKTLEIKTDEGFIFESCNHIKNIAFDKSETTITYRKNTDTIYSHMFVNGKWKDLYTRNYLKVQGVFAYMGGFLNVLTLLLNLLCKYLIYPDILKIFYDKITVKDPFVINKHGINKRIIINENVGKDNNLKNYNFSSINYSNIEMKNISHNRINNNSVLNEKIPKEQEKDLEKSSERKLDNESKSIGVKESKFRNINEIEQHNLKQEIKYEIDFKYDFFSCKEKLLRGFCFKKKRFKDKLKDMQMVEKLYIKKFSMEHITNLSRKVKLLVSILLDDYQRKLLKYLKLPNYYKDKMSFDQLYSKLQKKLEIENCIVNKNLCILLEPS